MPAPSGTVAELTPQDFEARLRGAGLGLRVGPFNVHLRARVAGLYPPLRQLYQDYRLVPAGEVSSCHVDIHDLRRVTFWRLRLVRFSVDGRAPHEDMPAAHALAVLEWGLNLVVALRFHRFLMLHAAVLERNGKALLLPAAPGHGKTTLCAALAHRGWRLLSDEFGLIRPEVGRLVPIPRPMPLKNESVGVIRAFAPDAVLGPEIPGTRKGTVAHVRPPASSVERAGEEVPARWVVFPRWMAGAPLSLEPQPRTQAFMRLATNAFNYERLGEAAFQSVRGLVDGSHCFALVYSNLEEAVATLTRLADDDGA